MSSRRFRETILVEHAALRRLLAETLGLADAEAVASAGLDQLRAHARQLYMTLEEHMSFAEAMLPTALRDVIGWGQALESRIAEDHARQRQELENALSALDAEALSWTDLAASLRAFADRLLRDIETEEAGLLEADLDAIATDSEGG